ncbi:hypothetical protein JB92DRAFT_2839025 [Gautieria morchelliformis]|nr:hypothetical protein JB92DRAFT_2839025 [Gautieria morchelliformis]
MFLLSDDKDDNTPTLKKARMEPGPRQPHSEQARSPSVKLLTVEQPPAQRRKGRMNMQVTEADKVPQSVVKQGYPEHAFPLGWKIFIRPELVMKPAKCGQCLHYSHMCSGQAGKVCGWCIRDRQACVSPEEYKAKEEKDAQEAETREWGRKAKARGKVKEKDKGWTAGPSLISSNGILGKLLLFSL